MYQPRLLISALRGSGAKTIISLGLITAFKRMGIPIYPFKKGPDYIDAAWMSKAAENPCKHLDLYLMGQQGVQEVFYREDCADAISIIEGNRGLYDGVDIHGTYSTARIAKLLDTPVVIIIDCTKTTNTVAPLVLGCQLFDKKVPIKGVILNHVSGLRHGEIISKSVTHHTGLPVLGILPTLEMDMPERHLGLTTVHETDDFEQKFEIFGDIAEKYLEMDQLLDIARNASVIDFPIPGKEPIVSESNIEQVIVGIIRDSAFQFYYPENLEALKREGATLIEIDSMSDRRIPSIDLLYIAGGFPEVYADKISQNSELRNSLRQFAEKGLPIYGECGAVIYLGRSVTYENQKYDMCGVFSLDFELSQKPAGHGYTEVEVDHKNPFFPEGVQLKGHEFHYSKPINWNSESCITTLNMKKGFGFDGERDGINKKNVFATYTHIHAVGTKNWAKWIISAAKKINFSKTR